MGEGKGNEMRGVVVEECENDCREKTTTMTIF